MIVLHVARARTDSINIRRSLGKTLACALDYRRYFPLFSGCNASPFRPIFTRGSLRPVGKETGLVILYVLLPASSPLTTLDQPANCAEEIGGRSATNRVTYLRFCLEQSQLGFLDFRSLIWFIESQFGANSSSICNFMSQDCKLTILN